MSEPIPDYYAVLEVARSAPEEEIQSAYRRCAMQAHPDRNPDPRDQSGSPDIRLINEAWDVLGDTDRRAAYDQLTRSGDASNKERHSPTLPPVPPGFGLHPRPAWGGTHFFGLTRELDTRRAALSLYAMTSDLSNLSRLGDDDLWLLDARRLPIKDSALRSVSRFRRLQVLMLDQTEVTDAGLHSIRPLPVLETLTLTKCRITDEGTPALAAIGSLRNLEIDETDVTDAGLAAFGGHPNLVVLDIRRTKVRGDGLRYLVDMPALGELRVSGRLERGARSIFEGRPEVAIL